MNELLAKIARRPLAWALPVLVVIAFVLGRCTGGASDVSTDSADRSTDDSTTEGGGDEDTIWTCSMHPQIRSHEPGQCPICGMDLVPLRSSGASTAPDRVSLSERAKVLAQIRTTPVLRAGAGAERGERRLLGRVTTDESTLVDVTTWVGGRIDRLHVDVTGARVRRGQVVATLYSPEVYAAHQDLLVAKRQIERLGAGTETARRAAQAGLEAARQRLRLLGVPDAELARLEEATEPTRTVAVRSPFAGTVVERAVTEGRYVQTGTVLYRLANLSRLWVQLDAYESDLPLLSVGQTVALTVEALPGVTIEGRVAFVDPVIDPMRRTARVRVEVDSQNGALRPGMFAEARLSIAAPESEGGSAPLPLVVPATAPLFTGRRSLVYVEVPNADRPTYEARVVRLGTRTGDVYPVLEGLSEGERVVTNGAFALDADLELRGGSSMMRLADAEGPSPAPVPMTDALRAMLAPVLEAYLDASASLASDDLARAKEAARRVSAAAESVAPEGGPARAAWASLAPHFARHAGAVERASDIAAARSEYEHLGTAVLAILRTFGNPTEAPVRVAHCPMVDDYRGADWVQQSADLANPYFGADMLTCGNIEATVPPRERLGTAPSATMNDAHAPRAAP